MTNQHYDVDLIVTSEDFQNSGWKAVLADTPGEGYRDLWSALSGAARAANEEGRRAHGKVLWLLADACSMMLSPASHNEPFKPFLVLEDRRSAVLDDFTDADIALFADNVGTVDDPWLKARLADLVWLRARPRSSAFALLAINAYRTMPLDVDSWLRGGREGRQRAISLAQQLGAGAQQELEEMETSILEAFEAATSTDGFFALWLAEVLQTYGLARACRANVAQRLEVFARDFASEGDLHRARAYFKGAAEWYKAISNLAKVAEMTALFAESWVNEAAARTSSGSQSYMAASSFYENAIQLYREIPRSERAALNVDERIIELRSLLNDSDERAMSELGVIRSPGVDISEIVENARKSVSGKSPADALVAFASLYRGACVDDLRKNALDGMQQSLFRTMMSSSLVSRDGRVIAKRPPLSRIGEATGDDEIAIRAEMIRYYRSLLDLVVQGSILPGRQSLLLEHRFREVDFVGIAGDSPIVPKDRVQLFGKALFAGYDGDFVTALHILIPQLEHMVRVHLKQAGEKTTNLDREGVEHENGMSTLMELEKADIVFGRDLAFELRALFCDAFGPNLRNELAHGLLDDDACHSSPSIYAWWLGFRLVFLSWWNVARADAREPDKEEVSD